MIYAPQTFGRTRPVPQLIDYIVPPVVELMDEDDRVLWVSVRHFGMSIADISAVRKQHAQTVRSHFRRILEVVRCPYAKALARSWELVDRSTREDAASYMIRGVTLRTIAGDRDARLVAIAIGYTIGLAVGMSPPVHRPRETPSKP